MKFMAFFQSTHILVRQISGFIMHAALFFSFRSRSSLQPSESRVALGRVQLQAAASESPDVRSLASSMAEVFADLFHAYEVEVEIHSTGSLSGFSVVWRSPRTGGTSGAAQTVFPLSMGENRLGYLRLRRIGKPYGVAETRELSLLAGDAAQHLHSALKVATAAEAAAGAERVRIAAQIHHGIAQYVANALTRLHLTQRYWTDNPARAQEYLDNSLTCAQMAMDAVRATIYSLRYTETGTPRIVSLLRATVDRLRAVTTAEFHLNVDDVGSLSPSVEIGIAAVAGEALTNAAKHANARHISVSLSKNNTIVTLEVRDDGIGFSCRDNRSGLDSWGQFGLDLMRDQVRGFGGTLDIQSVPGGETIVRVTVDVSRRRPPFTQHMDAATGQDSDSLGAPIDDSRSRR